MRALTCALAGGRAPSSAETVGASKGGKARRDKLTPEERSAIAKKAAEARWAKKRQQEEEESEG